MKKMAILALGVGMVLALAGCAPTEEQKAKKAAQAKLLKENPFIGKWGPTVDSEWDNFWGQVEFARYFVFNPDKTFISIRVYRCDPEPSLDEILASKLWEKEWTDNLRVSAQLGKWFLQGGSGESGTLLMKYPDHTSEFGYTIADGALKLENAKDKWLVILEKAK